MRSEVSLVQSIHTACSLVFSSFAALFLAVLCNECEMHCSRPMLERGWFVLV